MKLFKRFPKLKLARYEQQLLPDDKATKYPSFAADFTTLEKELMPHFRELDYEALSQQNLYRWMYIFLIFGGSLVTIVGIAQLAFLTVDWPGIVGGIVAALLAGTTTLLQNLHYHERYLNARLAAERLRSEYFLFLGCMDVYADNQDRVHTLRKRVADIKIQGEDATRDQNDGQLAQKQGQKSLFKGNTAGPYDIQQFFQLYQQYRYSDQNVWYTQRHKEFSAARTEAIVISVGFMILTAISDGFAVINIPWLRLVCLLAAAIFPVLSTAITAYNTLYGFEQQAKLYRDTTNALLRAQAIAPDTTPQSAVGTAQFSEQVAKYVQEVENIFLVEQGQWGQLAKQMRPPD